MDVERDTAPETDFLGEICYVVDGIGRRAHGRVKVADYRLKASSDAPIGSGRWARVVGVDKGVLRVTPLNAWLGSCHR